MKRIILDVGLLVILLLAMCFQFMPKSVHEVLGVAFFLLVALHLYRNRNWLKNLRWDGAPLFYKVTLLLDLLLLLDLVIIMVTGVFISNHLFKGLFGQELRRNILVHQLHVSLPYLFLIISGLHLGMHWRGLWQKFAGWGNGIRASKQYQMLRHGTVFCIAIAGLYGSFLNRLGDRLLLKHVFVTEAVQGGGAVFVICIVTIVGLYAVIGFMAGRMLANPVRKTETRTTPISLGGIGK